MNDQSTFQRLAAISAIVAAPVTLASTVVLLTAVGFDPEFMSDPARLITIGASASETFRWGSILELGAPTLLLVPAALYLWHWLKPWSPKLVGLYSVFGLTSLLLAAIGAILRATLYPALISAYSHAAEPQREVLAVIFQGITDFTFEGLWALELLFWGIWWLGVGLVLRGERRILGITTLTLGAAFLGACAGWLLRVGPLARLENLFFLVPVWVVWLGIVIWRRDEHAKSVPEPAPAAA